MRHKKCESRSLRHLAINILNSQKSRISNRRKIKRAAWNNAFLPTLLAQI